MKNAELAKSLAAKFERVWRAAARPAQIEAAGVSEGLGHSDEAVSDQPPGLSSEAPARPAGTGRVNSSEREVARVSTSASPAPSAPALEVRNLGVRYGGVVALDGVSFAVGHGQIVGLIGANGAGKTTLLDAISGFVTYSGQVLVDGQELEGVPARERFLRGVGRSFQSLELFEDLSIRENLLVATDRRGPLEYARPAWGLGRDDLDTEALALLRSLGINDDSDTLVGELGYGQRHLVSIARCLVSRPSIVLLDEPAAGLAPADRSRLSRQLKELSRGLGQSFLLIEHDVGMVLETVDHLEVIDFGRTIASGPPREVVKQEAVVQAYLGGGTKVASAREA